MSHAQHPQRSRFRSYFFRHWQAVSFSLGQLSFAPISSIMTVVVIGLALAVPTCFSVIVKNASKVTQSWHNDTQISLYLDESSSRADAEHVVKKLNQRSEVAYVNLISPEQGMQQLQLQGGLGDVLQQLSDNPLPYVIEVYPMPVIGAQTKLAALLSQIRTIDHVADAKLDMQWLQRLASIMNLIHRILGAFFLLIAIAVLLVINNTIRLVTQNKHREIEVYKLMGASHAYVRRPFLYTGVAYGLLGGLIAWGVVDGFVLLLQTPVMQLTRLYQSHFVLTSLSFIQGLLLLLMSGVLGFLGSLWAVNRHMAQMDVL